MHEVKGRRRSPGATALYVAAALITNAAVSVPASAATFPDKPIRLIVPFAPGGGVDLAGRVVAQRLTERLPQPVIVENRAGASGLIGAEAVARAAPDGYTLLIGSQTTQAVVPTLVAKPPYDGARDFAPVILVATSPLVVTVNPALPVKNVAQLIALAKARPGQLTFGAAAGGTPHMAGELFKATAGVDMLFVPYKGEGPAIADLIGGQIAVVFGNLPVVLPHVRSGRLRALAVTSAEQAAGAPDIPTVGTSGLPGFDASTWFGVFAPAATPREIVQRLNEEAAKGLLQPEVREKLAAQGLFVAAGPPEQLAKLLVTEIPRWSRIARASGLKLD
jgi:tripartite-type tricarboxylate transporter receptor subunit TctC